MKLRVVGVSGAGKTRLAREAGAALGLPVLELDAVFWDAGWQHRDVEEARAMVREFASAHPDGWIVEGNWSSRVNGLLDPGTAGGADAFVWLDHPRSVVMRRVVVRTLRRGLTREELWHGNREQPSDWLRWAPERNIVRWAWVQHPIQRTRMQARIAGGVPVVRLAGQKDADAWLAGLAEPGAPDRRTLSG